jgi:hypothetical protein
MTFYREFANQCRSQEKFRIGNAGKPGHERSKMEIQRCQYIFITKKA